MLYQEANYHDDGAFVQTRKDRTAESTLGWNWQLSRKASVNGEISYTENDSVLTIFSYERVKSQIGFVYLID